MCVRKVQKIVRFNINSARNVGWISSSDISQHDGCRQQQGLISRPLIRGQIRIECARWNRRRSLRRRQEEWWYDRNWRYLEKIEWNCCDSVARNTIWDEVEIGKNTEVIRHPDAVARRS